MKREWTVIVTVLLLLTLLLSPLTTFSGSASVYPTTTMPFYTTTTTRICCSTTPPPETTTTTASTLRPEPSGNITSHNTETTTTWWDCMTNTTWPPTTTTTIVLTGPDGTAPTTWPPTTTTTIVLTGPDGTAPTTWPPTTETTDAVCGLTVDLLSTAEIFTSDSVAMLGDPAGGNWLCCDCYSYDGETILIAPTNGSGWNLKTLPYLHITIRNNTPFSIDINAENSVRSYFAGIIGSDSEIIPKGGYAVSIDLADLYEEMYGEVSEVYTITEVAITLYNPGSITVGHLALSDQPVCMEPVPNIQTTTIPSFPWDDITTGTTDTTSGTTTPTTDNSTVTMTTTTYATTWNTTYPVTTLPVSSVITTTTTSPTTNPTVNDVLLPGDTDNDGNVTTGDARLILMYIAGNTTLTDHQIMIADFNFDGVANTTDVRLILTMLTQ